MKTLLHNRFLLSGLLIIAGFSVQLSASEPANMVPETSVSAVPKALQPYYQLPSQPLQPGAPLSEPILNFQEPTQENNTFTGVVEEPTPSSQPVENTILPVE